MRVKQNLVKFTRSLVQEYMWSMLDDEPDIEREELSQFATEEFNLWDKNDAIPKWVTKLARTINYRDVE